MSIPGRGSQWYRASLQQQSISAKADALLEERRRQRVASAAFTTQPAAAPSLGVRSPHLSLMAGDSDEPSRNDHFGHAPSSVSPPGIASPYMALLAKTPVATESACSADATPANRRLSSHSKMPPGWSTRRVLRSSDEFEMAWHHGTAVNLTPSRRHMNLQQQSLRSQASSRSPTRRNLQVDSPAMSNAKADTHLPSATTTALPSPAPLPPPASSNISTSKRRAIARPLDDTLIAGAPTSASALGQSSHVPIEEVGNHLGPIEADLSTRKEPPLEEHAACDAARASSAASPVASHPETMADTDSVPQAPSPAMSTSSDLLAAAHAHVDCCKKNLFLACTWRPGRVPSPCQRDLRSEYLGCSGNSWGNVLPSWPKRSPKWLQDWQAASENFIRHLSMNPLPVPRWFGPPSWQEVSEWLGSFEIFFCPCWARAPAGGTSQLSIGYAKEALSSPRQACVSNAPAEPFADGMHPFHQASRCQMPSPSNVARPRHAPAHQSWRPSKRPPMSVSEPWQAFKDHPPGADEINHALELLGYSTRGTVAETVHRVFAHECETSAASLTKGLSNVVHSSRTARQTARRKMVSISERNQHAAMEQRRQLPAASLMHPPWML